MTVTLNEIQLMAIIRISVTPPSSQTPAPVATQGPGDQRGVE